jgi:hypothetical protein
VIAVKVTKEKGGKKRVLCSVRGRVQSRRCEDARMRGLRRSQVGGTLNLPGGGEMGSDGCWCWCWCWGWGLGLVLGEFDGLSLLCCFLMLVESPHHGLRQRAKRDKRPRVRACERLQHLGKNPCRWSTTGFFCFCFACITYIQQVCSFSK